MKNKLLQAINRLIFVVLMLSFSAIAFAQNVGIGTAKPAVRLDVAGTGAYDLAATEGDFRLGDSVYRLKIGVGNTGANAGHAYIAASRKLFLGTFRNGFERTQSIVIDDSGKVGIGVTNPQYNLDATGDIQLGASSDNSLGNVGIGIPPFPLAKLALNSNQLYTALIQNDNPFSDLSKFALYVFGNFEADGNTTLAPSLDSSIGNVGIGSMPISTAKLIVSSNQQNTGIFQNTDSTKQALYVSGNTTLTGTPNNSTGNTGVGSVAISTAKLFVRSSQEYAGYFENIAPGKTGLYVVGNTILGNSADNTQGNVGIGTSTAADAKLKVRGNQQYTGYFENTDPNKFALIADGQFKVLGTSILSHTFVLGSFVTTGQATLTNTLDNTGGNVSMGVLPSDNIKMLVKSNQDFTGYFENTDPGKSALQVVGQFRVNGSTTLGKTLFQDGLTANGPVTLANSPDNSLGNVAVGSLPATNTKFLANSSQDTTAIFQNTAGKTALSVKGKLVADGDITLSQTSGNVGIGIKPVTNAKLLVSSSLDTTASFQNTTGKTALSVNGKIIANGAVTLAQNTGNVGIGIVPVTNTKFLVSSSLDTAASFQNIACKTALSVKGKLVADGDITLAQNTGNIGVGSTPLNDIKLYVLSNQLNTAYFHNSGGNNALTADGNVVLTKFTDNTRGNVGVGVDPANNAKLTVKSSLDYAAWVENTDATKPALYVKGRTLADGFVRLANSFDNSLGNVGIGNEPFLDTKLFVKSNQAYAAWVENINPANLALFVNGKMKLNGTSSTALDIVKGGDIRMEDDNSTSAVLLFAQPPSTAGAYNYVFTVLSDGKTFSFNGAGGSVSSDARLKQDITPIDNSLEKLMQLNGYSYRFKSKSDDPQKELGVLAQEVKAVLPEAVYTDSKGMYSVSYNSLVPLLINAVKEQQQQIADWKNKLGVQQEKLNTQQEEIAALKTMLTNQQELAKRIAGLEAVVGK
jgi:hypothetical protein